MVALFLSTQSQVAEVFVTRAEVLVTRAEVLETWAEVLEAQLITLLIRNNSIQCCFEVCV